MKEVLKNYKKGLLKEKEELKKSVVDSVFNKWSEKDIQMYSKENDYMATNYTGMYNNEYNLKMKMLEYNKKMLGIEAYTDLYVYLNSDSIDVKNEIENKYKDQTEKNIVKLIK